MFQTLQDISNSSRNSRRAWIFPSLGNADSENLQWFPAGMFGVMRAGGITALSSPAYGEDEMLHAIKTVKSKFIFASMSALSVVEKAADRLRIEQSRIFLLDGERPGFESIRTLIETGRRYGDNGQIKSFKFPPGTMNSKVCALLCFSSKQLWVFVHKLPRLPLVLSHVLRFIP